jgi:hypothetical protein
MVFAYNFWNIWQDFVKLGLKFCVVWLLYRMENGWGIFMKSLFIIILVFDGVWIETELQICQPVKVKSTNNLIGSAAL